MAAQIDAELARPSTPRRGDEAISIHRVTAQDASQARGEFVSAMW